MKLLLLGTTGYHPNDTRQTACFMLPDLGIVLDAGTAFYRVRQFLRTRELDIYLTHAHLDHCVGITYLFDVLRDRHVQRVTVHAESDKLAAIETHLLAEPLFPVRLPCDFRALAGDESLRQGGKLSYFPLDHPGGAVGYRLDWPSHSLAYVTDTTATADASYLSAIRGVDLLLHECYFPDSMLNEAEITGHSIATPVAQLARSAGVGRLILVHLSPASDVSQDRILEDARREFPSVELGHDMMEVEF
jgi:ribonuclease Z